MTILILTCPAVRKTFDIYNYFSANKKEYGFLVLVESHFLAESRVKLLYPQANVISHQTNDFISVLSDHVGKKSSDVFVYIPFEEEITKILLQSDIFDRYGNLKWILPALSTFECVRDKLKFAEYCLSNDIPVPRTLKYSEFISDEEPFFPVIVKPRLGSGAVGHVHVNNRSTLKELIIDNPEDYIVQEKLANPTVEGAFFLASAGNVLAYYGHKRLRTFPARGGVTVFSSYEENKRLFQLGSVILNQLKWSGLAMIEFMWDDDNNDYKVIEVNPRLWGSVLLSEFSGADLIRKYIYLCENRDLEERPVNTQAFIRWLVPYDIFLYISGGFKIPDFWQFRRESTCYISMSYAGVTRSVFWHFYALFNLGNLKKLIRKLLRK